MNSGKAKWIRKLVGLGVPQVMLMIRGRYGDKTGKMSYQQVFKSAKKLWKEQALGVEKWPKRKDLKKYERKTT